MYCMQRTYTKHTYIINYICVNNIKMLFGHIRDENYNYFLIRENTIKLYMMM